jgi:hypothetical protein
MTHPKPKHFGVGRQTVIVWIPRALSETESRETIPAWCDRQRLFPLINVKESAPAWVQTL